MHACYDKFKPNEVYKEKKSAVCWCRIFGPSHPKTRQIGMTALTLLVSLFFFFLLAKLLAEQAFPESPWVSVDGLLMQFKITSKIYVIL